jgi:hypothetical protein
VFGSGFPRSFNSLLALLVDIPEGWDANTKFFHLQACHHDHKNFVDCLQHQGATVVNEMKKAQVVFDHFDAILGSYVKRTTTLDFNVPSGDLSGLEFCFSEDEIWSVIRTMPPDKAPDPDGFMGMFYQTALPIIKNDTMQAFHALWQLDFRSFYLVNTAYLILLRKKPDANKVQDFCPISLIHGLLLSPHMNSFVMPNQSTFIKGRALHDNFRTVQLSAKTLHARRLPSVLLKVDIAKAFDTVSWPLLFDLLRHMGFSQCWINWLSILFSMESTRILLNGSPGGRICHAQGLRQGDPLSPLLFVLGTDVLNALFKHADNTRLLTPLQPRS